MGVRIAGVGRVLTMTVLSLAALVAAPVAESAASIATMASPDVALQAS